MVKSAQRTPYLRRPSSILFQGPQLSRYSSKVEVISETSLIAGTSALAPSTVHDSGESPGLYAALRGSNISSEHHPQLRGTPSR